MRSAGGVARRPSARNLASRVSADAAPVGASPLGHLQSIPARSQALEAQPVRPRHRPVRQLAAPL